MVAIPAHNEAERIGACLSALAMQRQPDGTPLTAGCFDVLVLANNCTDDTVAAARRLAEAVPFGLDVVERHLPPAEAHAGGARRAAMDLAAERLSRDPVGNGIIFTTDADSRAQPTWMASSFAALAEGADAVAGYVDADPTEYLALGAGFLRRGRLEDRFLARVAELHAILDPLRHDPWPNHRVNSGAAFAVSLKAYRAIGGLPCRSVGEDRALAEALDDGGFLIRHALAAVVTTSCRFDGRAVGGAGDTMRARHADLDAPCDGDFEPASRLFRRVAMRGRLRRLHAAGRLAGTTGWGGRLGLDPDQSARAADEATSRPFAAFWRHVEAESPALNRGVPLTPSMLPRETEILERLLRRLR